MNSLYETWKLEVWLITIILGCIAFLIGAEHGFKEAAVLRQHETFCINHPMDYQCKFKQEKVERRV